MELLLIDASSEKLFMWYMLLVMFIMKVNFTFTLTELTSE